MYTVVIGRSYSNGIILTPYSVDLCIIIPLLTYIWCGQKWPFVCVVSKKIMEIIPVKSSNENHLFQGEGSVVRVQAGSPVRVCVGNSAAVGAATFSLGLL